MGKGKNITNGQVKAEEKQKLTNSDKLWYAPGLPEKGCGRLKFLFLSTLEKNLIFSTFREKMNKIVKRAVCLELRTYALKPSQFGNYIKLSNEKFHLRYVLFPEFLEPVQIIQNKADLAKTGLFSVE